MISFDEAVAAVCSVAQPLGVERVPLRRAAGRVLASPVVARRDSPPFDASAMDGYAVRDLDLAGLPATLRVAGRSFAGGGWNGRLATGECVRIFTGAPLPQGADRVIVQENVAREGDRIRVDMAPEGRRHVRSQGCDFRAGDVLLQRRRRMTPGAVVAAAGADVGELEVFRRPKVVVVGTGDELVEPGAATDRPAAIPESVSFGAAALAEIWGAEVRRRPPLRDQLPAMQAAALELLENSDLVVVTGGASVGEKDFAKAMFEPAGLDLLFSKVRIRPGKPVWLGRVGTRLVLGLPGNPTSALVTARLFLAPLLCGLAGLDPRGALRWRGAAAGAPLGPTGERETFLRGRRTAAGIEPLAEQDSSGQRSLAMAEVLLRRRSGAGAVEAGREVEIIDLW